MLDKIIVSTVGFCFRPLDPVLCMRQSTNSDFRYVVFDSLMYTEKTCLFCWSLGRSIAVDDRNVAEVEIEMARGVRGLVCHICLAVP